MWNEINFKFSKYNQRGESQVVIVKRASKLTLCPVKALVENLAMRPDASSSLFCHFDDSQLESSEHDVRESSSL